MGRGESRSTTKGAAIPRLSGAATARMSVPPADPRCHRTQVGWHRADIPTPAALRKRDQRPTKRALITSALDYFALLERELLTMGLRQSVSAATGRGQVGRLGVAPPASDLTALSLCRSGGSS